MKGIAQAPWAKVIALCAIGLAACSNSSDSTPRGTVAAPGNGGVAPIGPVAGTAAPGVAGTSGATGVVPTAGTAGTGAMPPMATAGAGVAGTAPMGVAGTGAGMAGTMGSAGAGMPPMTMGGDPTMCPAAPMGASDAAIAALAAVNSFRVPAGSGCIHDVLALNMSAGNHCSYYAMNQGNQMCIADPHGEVMGCAGYVGNLGARIKAAGYTGFGSSEVMAFVNNPMSSVAQWVNTVWHRGPILDPWTADMGYGNATMCDTIDFGRGTPTAGNDTVVVYPYNGQTNVPTTFDGSHEGPMPPAPSTGWPSSSPVNMYAKGIKITEHTITLDGDATPIDHVWLDPTTDTSMANYLTNVVYLYANKPFTANTKYHVKFVGTRTGGTINVEWTFTTGAASRWGF